MADKRLNWFQRNILGQKEPIKEVKEIIVESQTPTEVSDTIIKSLSTSSLTMVDNIDTIVSDERALNTIYDQMDQDAVISSALDLFADNSTIPNQKTGHVAAVEMPSDPDIQEELNDFLWNIFKVDTEAWHLVRSIVKYGKVVIDTDPDEAEGEWAFSEVEDLANVHALVTPAGKIKYYAFTNKLEPDRNNPFNYFKRDEESLYKVEPSSKHISAFNSREIKGTMTIRTESEYLPEGFIDEELKIRSGRSILNPVINTWQTLSNMENAMYVNRLTKSTQFKVVQVDVTGLNNKEANVLLNDVKNVLKNSETVDRTNNQYYNRRAPVTVDDMVILPKKGEQGSVSFQSVGGELNEAPMKDIEYLRNKLFAGLGVLKAYLGFEETTPGGLGDSTLSKLDERFGRRIQRLQTVLRGLLEEAVASYWINSSQTRTEDNLPEFKIVLGKVSTKEDADNRAVMTDNINTADKILALLKDEWFVDKIDVDKAFKYIFETVLSIDTSTFDRVPSPDDIKITVGGDADDLVTPDISEDLEGFVGEDDLGSSLSKEDLIKMAPKEIEGSIKTLINQKDVNALMKEYDIILEDSNYRQVHLEDVLKTKSFKEVLNEETYKSLRAKASANDPKRIAKSKKIVVRYTGIDNDNYITFSATAEDPKKNKAEGKPTSYTTRVNLKDLAKVLKHQGEFTDRDLVLSALQGDIAVGCTCPASKYWGQEYVGTQNDYSIVHNDIPPTRNVPTQVLCKHILSTTLSISFWWNTIVRDLRNKGLLTKHDKQAKATTESVENTETEDASNTAQ